MLLLTTPDYFPKLGGLSSHTLNVEKVLKSLNIQYKLFHWKSYRDILSLTSKELDEYELILNIHTGFHMYMPPSQTKVINYINGAEILFYSPNFIKNLLKNILKKKGLNRLQSAHYNIFISDFTFRTLISKGYRPDYSRDLVFHMAVDTSGHQFCQKKWEDKALVFICVARDVPHKNFTGAINFCERVQEISGRKVEFVTITDKKFSSSKIKISSYINPDNQLRDKLLAKSHINILFSLDQSHKGFFEGFGQIVQEAGCFATPSLVLNTGGLPESVHHNKTGWVLDNLSLESIQKWWDLLNEENYQRISKVCYEHTLDSHGLKNWESLFSLLIKNEK